MLKLLTDQSLRPHPAGGAGTLSGVSASCALAAGGRVALEFVLRGHWQAVEPSMQWPPGVTRAGRRRAALWHHTCLELFLGRIDAAPGYLELNFALTGEWAAYEFDGYRSGQRELVAAAPAVQVIALPEALQVRAGLTVPSLQGACAAAPAWRLNLAAVIEARAGQFTYWCLQHGQPQPDFHDPAGFALAPLAAGL